MELETPLGSAASLPCLNSGISIENSYEIPLDPLQITPFARKTAFILQQSISTLSARVGLDFLGFLTLTFSDHVIDPKEASRRFNSLVSNVIKPRYVDYVGVFERQKSGRIHFHLLITMPYDIRTGVDFKALSDKDYSTVGQNLRSEWAFWRKTAKKYGFGRTELLPVKSSIEAMAKYVGKYISKHLEARQGRDKGARLVRYSKGARSGTTRFQWASAGSAQWRLKLKIFASYILQDDSEPPSMKRLSEVLGPRWAYRHREMIFSIPTDGSIPC
jgi:hypothetical protein